MFPFLALLAFACYGLLTIACLVHLVRTGRPPYWVLIFIFAGPVGVLLYAILEMWPDVHRSPSVNRLGSQLANTVAPGRSIKRLQEDVMVSDTIKNRQALAAGYMLAGRHAEAVEQYAKCLTGIYKEDPPLMAHLASAQFAAGDYAAAKASLERLAEVDSKFRPTERQLLYARILEELGDVEGALEVYDPLVAQASGEEARCRHALLLEQVGRDDEAQALFARILLNAKRSPRYYRANQREWIRLARQHLN